jgi:hypothetical protein
MPLELDGGDMRLKINENWETEMQNVFSTIAQLWEGMRCIRMAVG